MTDEQVKILRNVSAALGLIVLGTLSLLVVGLIGYMAYGIGFLIYSNFIAISEDITILVFSVIFILLIKLILKIKKEF